jgi:hypothetical protein
MIPRCDVYPLTFDEIKKIADAIKNVESANALLASAVKQRKETYAALLSTRSVPLGTTSKLSTDGRYLVVRMDF